MSLDTNEVEQLHAEISRYRVALENIAEGSGPYSRDQLTHCSNTVEAMKALALEALGAPRNVESAAP